MALACSKHGSRSLDAIWRRSSAKGREWIAAELAEKEAALNASQFGRFFVQKCALSTFKRARGDWAKVRFTFHEPNTPHIRFCHYMYSI